MSKKTLSIIIIILILVTGAIAFWFFFMNKGVSTNIPDGSKAPFGAGGNVIPGTGNTTTVQPPVNVGTSTISGGPDMMLPGLYQISKNPISGITVFDNKKATQIRFVDRTTGHIFERVRGQIDTIRLTNTTIPRVYEALWSSDGRELVMRYLKDDNETIRSFYARLNASSTPDQEISGLFLEDNIRSMSAYGSKILSVKRSSVGSSIILSGFDGSKPVSVFTSPFMSWNVVYSGINLATLYSAPSSASVGSLYSLSLSTGAYKKISSSNGIEGLVSPDGKKTLASDSALSLFVVTTASGSYQMMPVRTLAEKCVWANDSVNIFCAVPKSASLNSYPDSWYQGLSSFDDTLWKINTGTGEGTNIADLANLSRTPMDVVNLSINQLNNILVFKNKQDLSGWAYVLN